MTLSPFALSLSHKGNASGEQSRICLIEDNFAIADWLTWALELEGGYHIDLVVRDQIRSLTWVDQVIADQPMLMLLDIDIGGVLRDPVEFLRQIHNRGRSISMEMTLLPPIILLTTQDQKLPDLEREGYPVLLKPVHVKDLLDTVKMAVDRHRELQSSRQASVIWQGIEEKKHVSESDYHR
jgi:DNA-binding response OmpR family regulator